MSARRGRLRGDRGPGVSGARERPDGILATLSSDEETVLIDLIDLNDLIDHSEAAKGPLPAFADGSILLSAKVGPYPPYAATA